jgi:hypothetical protein
MVTDNLLELRHNLWVKVQVGAPPRVLSLLQEAKEIALTLSKPYLTIYQWQGQGQAGPLTVSFAGFEYAKAYLKSILFAEEPAEREVGRVPIWRPGQLADSSEADISFVVAGKRLIARLPRQNALVQPFRTRLTLDVRGEWEEVVQRFHYNARRNEVRKVRKYGYTYEVGHSDADFEQFYQTMYLPTMRKRHAELATLLSFDEAYEYFRRGSLLLVKRDGDERHVAGVVCYPERKVLYAIIIGILDGDEQLIKELAGAAGYYSSIHWAHQQGYEAVDFWGSKPYLTALFLYKRKWGVTVGVPSDMPQRIWFKIRRDTPAVRQFLKDNPCIILDEAGALWGLIVTDDPDNVAPEVEAAWHKRYATPGLEGLLIRSVADLSRDPDGEPGAVKNNLILERQNGE